MKWSNFREIILPVSLSLIWSCSTPDKNGLYESKSSTPKFPEKKVRLEELANSMENADNPIIVMVTLKKRPTVFQKILFQPVQLTSL